MERQTEPPINQKKKKGRGEKGENQNTTMACIGIEIKEKREKGKKNVPQGGRNRERRCAQLTGEESRPAKTQNGWKGSFSEKVKEKYLNKIKKTGDGEVLKLRSPKELKTSGKPNSATSENINSINRDMPRGHSPRSAATTHLMRHVITRVTQKKKKKLSIFYGRHRTPWRPKNRGQLTELTRPIKDEHSREDDVTPKTSPGNARVTDEHRVAIQYLQ